MSIGMKQENISCSESDSSDSDESSEPYFLGGDSLNSPLVNINSGLESILPETPRLEDDFGTLILPPEDREAFLPDYESSDEEDDEKSSVQSNQLPSLPTVLSETKPKKRRKKKKKVYSINLANCKYESVRRVSQRLGLRVFYESEDYNIFWTDLSVTIERVCSLKRWQKVNHFPGMSEICRKDSLARNLNRMAKLFPKAYTFHPKSWCLPTDYGDLQNYSKTKKNKTYILKPDTGCQGKGIWLTKSPSCIKATDNMVCQVYLGKPLLVDGFKFDMRVYVLITSCDPLRIYVFKDGLARFATQRYKEPTHGNVGNVFIHLTNYAVQKHSCDFVRDDEELGTKRRITTVNRWLIANGYDVDKLWAGVDDAIIKTILSGYGVLKHSYRTCFPNHIKTSACFEILGFDVILDKNLKPYILEVNHSPSFQCDSRLDKEIKEALLWDTFKMANLPALDRKACIEEDRRKIKERLFSKTSCRSSRESRETWEKNYRDAANDQEFYELQNLGNFRRIYPPLGKADVYSEFFTASYSLFSETVTFKARTEFARQIREEIKQKQEANNWMKRNPRPESPGSRRKSASVGGPKFRSPKATTRSVTVSSRLSSKTNAHSSNESRVFQPILEQEENERLGELIQREALLRRTGVIELIYKLLSGTSGVGHLVPNTTKVPYEAPTDLLFKNEANINLMVGSFHLDRGRRNKAASRVVLESGGNHYWINGSMRKPTASSARPNNNFSVEPSTTMTMTNFITKPALLTRQTESTPPFARRATTTALNRPKQKPSCLSTSKTPADATLAKLHEFYTKHCSIDPVLFQRGT